MKSQLSILNDSCSQERADFLRQIFTLEKNIEENEKIKTELGSHVWNLTEEIRELKKGQERSEMVFKKLRCQLVKANDEEFELRESLQKLVSAREEVQKDTEKYKLLANRRGQVLLSDIADLKEVVRVKNFHCSSLVESQRNQRQILNDREENMRALESSVHLIKSKCVELQVDFQVKTEELQRVDMVRDELKKSLSQKDATIQTLELELIVSYD